MFAKSSQPILQAQPGFAVPARLINRSLPKSASQLSRGSCYQSGRVDLAYLNSLLKGESKLRADRFASIGQDPSGGGTVSLNNILGCNSEDGGKLQYSPSARVKCIPPDIENRMLDCIGWPDRVTSNSSIFSDPNPSLPEVLFKRIFNQDRIETKAINNLIVRDLSRRSDYPSVLCRIDEVYRDRENLLIQMERLPGWEFDGIRLYDLLDVLNKRWKGLSFDAKCAANIMIQLLDALAYLESHGFIYTDIKPENICFRSSDAIALVDFDDRYEPLSRKILVTQLYAPPELRTGDQFIRAQQVWSIGMILLMMASKSVVNSSDYNRCSIGPDLLSRYNIRLGIINRLISDLCPGMEPILEIAQRAFKLNPEDRITVAQLRDEFIKLM